MNNRDKELDITKGVACILMILAHSATIGRTIDNSVTVFFWYLGFFAPILFFASIGTSLIYQIKKRSIKRILIFNLLLFIVSFSDIGKQSLNYFDITQPNLVASLALATMVTVLFRKINGLIILIILLGLDRLGNRFLITPTIFYGVLFALIPWTGITTLGKYLFENKKIRIYILALGLLITAFYVFFKHQTIQTQFLTSLFLGVSLIIYSSTLIFAGKLGKVHLISNLLIYLGKNTLLFYWLHLFILFVINFRLPAPAMWLFVLISTIIGMNILKKINNYTFKKISGTIWFWIILIFAVFLPTIMHFSQQTQFFFFNALTLIFALNYHQFLHIKTPSFHKL